MLQQVALSSYDEGFEPKTIPELQFQAELNQNQYFWNVPKPELNLNWKNNGYRFGTKWFKHRRRQPVLNTLHDCSNGWILWASPLKRCGGLRHQALVLLPNVLLIFKKKKNYFDQHTLLADCYNSRVALSARMGIDDRYRLVTMATSAHLYFSNLPCKLCSAAKKLFHGLRRINVSGDSPNWVVRSTCY